MSRELKLTCKMKMLIVVCFVLTGIFRLIILIIPFKVTARLIGKEGYETPFSVSEKNLRKARIVGWAVVTASSYTPWKSLCMVQALTSQLMLGLLSISSTLYLGLAKMDNKLSAHAWVRSGSDIITGGNNMAGYQVIVCYGRK